MIKTYVNRIIEIVYYCTLSLYIVGTFFNQMKWVDTGMWNLGTIFQNVAIIIMLALLLMQSMNSRWLGLISLLVIIGVIAYFLYSGKLKTFVFLLIILLSASVNEERIKKLYLFLYLGLFALIIIAGVTGKMTNYSIDFLYGTGWSLGFGHPNSVGAFCFAFSTILRFTILKKRNLLFLLVCVGFAAFVWFYAACRTIAILLLVFPLFSFFLGFLKKKGFHVLNKLLVFLPLLCFSISLILSLYITRLDPSYDGGNMLARFVYPARYIRENGFSLLGAAIPDKFILDNAYMRTILVDGILWALVILACLTFVMYRLAKYEKADYLAVFSLFVVYGLMESCVLSPLYDTIPAFILVIGQNMDRTEIKQLSNKSRGVLTIVAALLCVISVLIITIVKVDVLLYSGLTFVLFLIIGGCIWYKNSK